MARFLDTTAVSDRIVQVIKTAAERLTLVSPYLKMNRRVKELLEEKSLMKALNISVVYGKNELHPDEMNWLKSQEQIKTWFRKSLHAKCYLNEKEAVITSMNLHEFSGKENDEMGLQVLRSEEPALYEEIRKEVDRIIQNSEQIRVVVEHIAPEVQASSSRRPPTAHVVVPPKNGACIRCSAELKLDPLHPYCRDCYAKWKVYENAKYEEKYCHICAKANKSTLQKPTCMDCYKKFKDSLEFAK
jgi:phosphatidylserine/phosphatidylglycerophosphate/cardiolipin synthase-like enzyme